MPFANDPILILGLGASGAAAAHLADRVGGRPIVTDDRAVTRGDALPDSAEFVSRADAERRIRQVRLVVTSPGVPATHPLLSAATAAGIEVVSELEFAFRHIDSPVLAVTGTNGKSTTTTLLGRILEEAGCRVFVGGNLGRPLSHAAGAAYDYCVVEVSSFQLEWVRDFHARAAVILNVTPDHLDRHGDLASYRAMKWRVFQHMSATDRAVLCRTEDWWREVVGELSARTSTFGPAPLAAGELGMAFDRAARTLCGDHDWLARIPGLWPRAPHDFENLAAATELARFVGVEAEVVERALAEFRGLEHRLQYVGESRGVRYWNDSKATNLGATVRSLEAFDEPVILMAGGVGKGVCFDGLLAGAGRMKAVVTYGQSAAEIAAALIERVPLTRVRTFDEAFRAAVGLAKPGDVVLLAPACASFDEFRDYADRGRTFVRRVAELGS